MVDIHAHILPGIGDGARDIYDALLMAQQAVDSGVTEMVATPHCNVPGQFGNYYGRAYQAAFGALSQALHNERIPLKLYPGMEVYATEDLPALLSEGRVRTINGSRYLLIEFDSGVDPAFACHLLGCVYREGFRPVIAHPERYDFVQEMPEIVHYWHSAGYLLQVNKSSFYGAFGRQAQTAAYELLDNCMISAIASDAHSVLHRTTQMKSVYDKLSRDHPQQYIDALFYTNPKRICENQATYRFCALKENR